MWGTLATRVYICITATLLVALAASAMAVITLWQTSSSMERILEDNLPSVIAGQELEIALLQQRGCLASFLLSGGDPAWLAELRDKQHSFQEWHDTAQKIAFTEDEQVALASLAEVVQRYNARREDVIELFREGRAPEGQQILVGDVNKLFLEAFRWCKQLTSTNQRVMEDTSKQAVGTVRRVSVGMFAALALQLIISSLLIVLFYRAVLGPLRQMAVDLRGYSSAIPEERSVLGDEVEIVAKYLRLLLTDVADFRSALDRQRRELFDSQKMASVGRLAASLAHEIRNPLTAMKIWLYSARGALADGSEVASTLEAVTQEVRRLEAIVRQFLEFSRPPDTRLAWVPTGEICTSSLALVEPLLHEKSITFRADIGSEVPKLFVDREQLIQVIVNLLRNAAESLPVGGEIRLSAQKETNAAGQSEAVLRVSDNGPGIPPELQAKVFEPFFTTKDEGTGLGLSIVASIVMRHGGRIEVEPTPGPGATFAVHLPLPLEERPA